MKLSNFKLKNFWITKVYYISFHISCLLRENVSSMSAKEKSFLYFLYKKSTVYKLNYFLIIIIKRFLSFIIFFSILTQSTFFIFWQIFGINTAILLLFFFSFFRKILISFISFFCSLSLFSSEYSADKILEIYIYIYI